jgi:hypothetical protein
MDTLRKLRVGPGRSSALLRGSTSSWLDPIPGSTQTLYPEARARPNLPRFTPDAQPGA